MINLQKISGLPISLDDRKLDLIFDGDFPMLEKKEKTLEELKPYLKDGEIKEDDRTVYSVWHNVHLKNDIEKFEAAGLKFGLTLIPPGKIGEEFVKTAGHCHQNPEYYEVWSGRGFLILQTPVDGDNNRENLKSVFLVEIGPGEKFVIPPDFSGHAMINAFNEPLLFASLVSEKAIPDYGVYKKNSGASYYLTDGGETIEISANPKYGTVPEIKKIGAQKQSETLYSFINDPEKVKLLNS